MENWDAIRAEYIQGGITYRQLVEKHGVPLRTLAAHAKDEGWVELRKQASDRAATLAVDAAANAKADMATRIFNAAGELLEKTMSIAKTAKSAKEIRLLTGSLKDIRDIIGIRSEEDMQEQQARIAALRAKAAGGTEDEAETGVIFLPRRLDDDDECSD